MKSKEVRKKYSGLTLIEASVYLAIFGVIFASVLQFSFTIIEGNDLARRRIEAEKNTIFLIEHINESFEESDSVDIVNTIFDSDNGRIRVLSAGGYMQYSIVNGTIVFDENGITTNLSNPTFIVGKLRVEAVENSENTVVGARIIVEFRHNKDAKVRSDFTRVYLFE